MAGNPPSPKFMIRIDLTPVMQNKLLHQISRHFRISESYAVNHIITVAPHIFGKFIADVAQMEEPPTLKQLKVELINRANSPRRTILKYEGLPYNEES